MKHTAIVLIALAIVLAACSVDDEAATTTAPGATVATTQPDTAATAGNVGPVAATPAQPEGPYYPVEKLNDRDNDLTVVSSSGETADGEVLSLDGLLVTTAGEPMIGATIEIWQTDEQGIYLHPGDPNTAVRDQSFQFYGEAVTLADGSWSFLTILPGEYEPRPRHIHAKVVVDGDIALTTQIYFSADDSGQDPRLVAAVEPGTDENGRPILTASHIISLDR